MQTFLPSLLFLRNLHKKNKGENNSAQQTMESTAPTVEVHKKRREQFVDWLSPKPKALKVYPGETVLFHRGLVLVTDTRLAYIDPFDRMLKTYMFEHMISVHKQFYRTTLFNRRLCKGLLILSFLVFLVILTIDLLDSNSGNFFLIYLPLLASIVIGLKVWGDMKPRYVLHWRMRDMSYEEIVQEPMLRERILGGNKREEYMTDLANAMNEAMSGKAWWPDHNNNSPSNSPNNASTATAASEAQSEKRSVELVTDSYQ